MSSIIQGRSPLEKYPLALSTMVVGLAFGLLLCFVRPTFETNDDVFMMGVMTGHLGVVEPSEMLVLSHFLLGRVLSGLYAQVPAIPWYAITLLLTHFVAHLVLLWALLLLAPKRATVSGFLGYLAIVGVHLLCHFSYTTSAFLAGQSGLALLFASLSRPCVTPHIKQFRIVVALLLIVVSCAIRWESCCLVLILSTPVWGVVLWSTITTQRTCLLRTGQLGSVGALVLATVGLTIYTDHLAYANHPEWVAYWKRHVETCQIVDYGRLQALVHRPHESTGLLREVGWTPNDFWLLKSWFFFDSNVFAQDKIRLIGNRWSRFQRASFKENLAVFLGASIGVLKHPVGLLTLLIFILSCVRSQDAVALWSCRAIWMTALGGMIYLAYFKKLPDRVFIPILVFASVQTMMVRLYFAPQLTRSVPAFRVRLILSLIAIPLLLAVGGYSLRKDFRWNHTVRKQSKSFWQDVNRLSECKVKLIVTWSVFPFDVISPYDDLRPLEQLRFFSTNFYQSSPHLQSVLGHLGIKNLAQSLYTDSDILLASSPELNTRVGLFLKEHYQADVQFETAFTGDSGFNLYRLHEMLHKQESPSRDTAIRQPRFAGNSPLSIDSLNRSSTLDRPLRQ